jgi:hypothetical protein
MKLLSDVLEILTTFLNKLLELFSSIIFHLKKVIIAVSPTFSQLIITTITFYFAAKFVTFDKTGLMFPVNLYELSQVFVLFAESNISIFIDFLKSIVASFSNYNFLQSDNARLILENQELRATLSNYQSLIQNSVVETSKLESELYSTRTERDFFKSKAENKDLIYKNSIYPPDKSPYFSYFLTFLNGTSAVYQLYSSIFPSSTGGMTESDRMALQSILGYARGSFKATATKQTFSSKTDLLNDLEDKSV